MQANIDVLSDHYIVCGYSRVGRMVVEEIAAEGLPVVVIESDSGLIPVLEQKGILYLRGDATSDKMLMSAGIKRAKGLVTALSMESTSVYAIAAARQLNSELLIVSRTDTESHITRMEQAGANKVVMPHKIGGLEIASCVMQPGFHTLGNTVWGKEHDLQISEYRVEPGSSIDGISLGESRIRSWFNLLVVAVCREEEKPVFNPRATFQVREGDILFLMGRRQDLLAFRESV